MNRIAATLLATLLSCAAAAQEESPARPDYSRESLLRLVASIPEPPAKRGRDVRFIPGGVELRALGMRWRLIYLPIMTPLSGSELRTTSSLPDPFSLTGTSIASPPRTWRTQRTRNAELERIEKLERARIRVK